MRKDSQRKLGVFIWFGYQIPIPERLQRIRETGFETVLHSWDDSFKEQDGFSREEQVALIRKAGLEIENAHLQFRTINDLWLDTQDGQAVFEGYLADMDSLARHEIPVAVLHPTTGKTPPPISDTGMRRIRALVERAEKRGVRIAMENVRKNEYLVHILDSIASPMLGLCYDSGHDLIWSAVPYALLDRYKDRLFAVHLHDNRGQNDDHLAPGEGIINWEIVRAGIERSAYLGSYTLESDSAEIPASRTPREHLRMHYEGALKVLMG